METGISETQLCPVETQEPHLALQQELYVWASQTLEYSSGTGWPLRSNWQPWCY